MRRPSVQYSCGNPAGASWLNRICSRSAAVGCVSESDDADVNDEADRPVDVVSDPAARLPPVHPRHVTNTNAASVEVTRSYRDLATRSSTSARFSIIDSPMSPFRHLSRYTGFARRRTRVAPGSYRNITN